MPLPQHPQTPGQLPLPKKPGGLCPKGETVDGKGIFRWPHAMVGITVRIPCPPGPVNGQKTKFARRRCTAQGWNKPNTSDCGYQSSTSRQFDDLLTQVNVKPPKDVASSLLSLVDHPFDLSPEDFFLASSLFDDVLDLGFSDVDIVDDLFGTASQLLRGGRDLLRKGNAATRSSKKLMRGIEQATRKYPLPKNPPFPVINEESLTADMFDISPGNFKGFSFFEKRTPGRYGRGGPRDLLYNDVSVGIELPETLLSSFDDESVRINFLLYDSADLFQDWRLPDGRVDNNTKVVGCFVNNASVQNLTDPVKIVFTSFQPGYAPQCVFWDELENDGFGGWSSEGCELVQSNSTTVICSCNHLTSFSVVFSLCGDSCPCKSVSDSSLSIISYVGCALSILGLLLTLACLPIIKCRGSIKNPLLNSTHIIFNFCINLLLSLVVFFTIRPAASGSEAGCTTSALLLHYFILTTFLWMLMEGISMYRDFVIAIGVNTSSTAFLKTAYSITYGVPALVVLVLLAVQLATKSSGTQPFNASASYSTAVSSYDYFSGDYGIYYDDSDIYSYPYYDEPTVSTSANDSQEIEIYGVVDIFRDDDTLEKDVSYCWIKHTGIFLGTFAIPALLICLFNLSITLRIYFVLRRSAKMRASSKKTRKENESRARAMMLVSSLLGLTWLFGVFTLIDFQSFLPKSTSPNSAVCHLGTSFHYVFAILNSLQGFCVFLFYIVLNRKVRKQLGVYCCPKRYASQKIATNISAASGVSMQTLSGSNESLDYDHKNGRIA